ncbi:MAG TPA: JAB domain-containing protein [Herpetosiphonaceae bacterium]
MPRRKRSDAELLREALVPYINIHQLRHLVACQSRALEAALRTDHPPADVRAMLNVLSALLHPAPAEQIATPDDVAALLLVEMGLLAQEQIRVICLNTKGQIQTIHAVYQSTVNAIVTRPIELLREAFRHNSASVILAHNHPSGDPEPSEEDLIFTEQMILVGDMLGIQVLDHLIIGRGTWVSLRQQSLVFKQAIPAGKTAKVMLDWTWYPVGQAPRDK